MDGPSIFLMILKLRYVFHDKNQNFSFLTLVKLNLFSAMGSTAGSIADTDRGTDEELDDFNEEEDQESFSALYRLVNEESPPPEMPQPKRKTSVASVEAR